MRSKRTNKEGETIAVCLATLRIDGESKLGAEISHVACDIVPKVHWHVIHGSAAAVDEVLVTLVDGKLGDWVHDRGIV